MCGRFALNASPELLRSLFELNEEPYIAERYNIAPTQPVAVVRMDAQTQQRQWALLRWGLIPSWSKDPAIGAQLINARSETVTEKPSFRSAFKRRRCLIPASGFYEWQKSAGGKQPYFIHMKDHSSFAIAGLWESWSGSDGEELQTCTLLTTEANALMAPLHDRMPVIIEARDYGLWLGSGREETPAYLQNLLHLLRPYADDALTAYAVDTYVNNTRNEGERCIARHT
jgi:putative SOS response-associated peptidase YedK